MRIALFHNLPSGGAKRALFEWTRRLARKHTIDVYSLTTADHTFCDIRPFASQHYVFDFTSRGLFDSPLGRLNQLQRLRDLNDLDNLQHQIAEQINECKYDVVFAHTCIYTFIPALLQYIELPSVYYLHEPFGPSFVRSIERPYLPRKRWQQLLDVVDPFLRSYNRRLVSIQARSVAKSSRLLSNSNFTAECIKTSFGVDSSFCPIGVDADSFQPMRGSLRQDFVLSVGEMSPRKGFDFIIESLGKIPEVRRPALKIACNMIQENERRFIENLAKTRNVDLQILFRLDTTELCRLYTQARLCIYAPVLEPFGLIPLEAMACETPVVAVSEGGVRESVVDGVTGCLVERNSSKFAEAVISLLDHPEVCQRYGQQARQHILERWTWDTAVEKLEGFLKETIVSVQKTPLPHAIELLVCLGYAMHYLLPTWHLGWIFHNFKGM